MASFFDGLIAVIYVYLIGVIYSLKELWVDRKYPVNELEVREKAKEFRRFEKNGVAVVTGADGQIGRELVKYLVGFGYIVCSISFTNPMVDEDVHHYPTDLSDKEQVCKTAQAICSHFPKGVSLVICNAGVMLHPFALSEVEHVEMHLAVNVLGHAILINHLQPILKASRNLVVFVSSATCQAGHFTLEDVESKDFWRKKLNGYQAYANSKLLVSLFAELLAEEEKERFPKTTFVSLHPGVVPGRLYRYANSPFRFLINSVLAPYLRKSKTAALRILDLSFTPVVKNGGYYEDGYPVPVTKKVDRQVAQHLYEKITKEIENSGFFDSADASEVEVVN